MATTTVNIAFPLSVADINDPSAELNAIAGDAKGALRLCYQTAAGADEWNLYAWDDAATGSESVPYSVDGSTGRWVCIAGCLYLIKGWDKGRQTITSDIDFTGYLTFGGNEAAVRGELNVEDGATADQTAAEIRTLVEAATDSNVFTDADHTKLNGIDSGATDDQTGAEIKALYEAEANAYTDTKDTKLSGIETAATADQTDAEIRAAVEAATDSNVFTDADHTKLNGIETAADVTDATNVDAAGATMNTDTDVSGNSWVLDEDDMTSNSNTKVPTQQSVIEYVDATVLDKPESFIVACSDETSDLATGTAVATFRMPYGFTLTNVLASVTTAPTGATVTVDINESGTTILSTKLTIDASEKTSATAATGVVISDSSLAEDAEITIDIDQVGSTIAGTGLKVTLIGHQV